MTELGADSESSQQDPLEKTQERWATAWAFAWFCCLMIAYYVLRPLRETMGTVGDVKNLRWLFLVVFGIMLVLVPVYSQLVATIKRQRLIPLVFRFFAINLLGLAIALGQSEGATNLWVARVFFVWVSVFGLFAVSIFWSVMADLFHSDQGKRRFGMIAAGGSCGGLIGSFIAGVYVEKLGLDGLLIIPLLLMEACVLCYRGVERQSQLLHREAENELQDVSDDQGTGGSMFAAFIRVVQSPYLLAVSTYVAFVPFFGTAIYLQQAEIVKEAIETPAERTTLFAQIDFAVQVFTLLLQSLVVGLVMKRLGMSVTLVVLPVICGISCFVLAQSPTLFILCVIVVITRTAAYAIAAPAREVLFTVVSREDKYKTKSLCDLAIYRGSDVFSSTLVGSLRHLGATISQICWGLLPIAIGWLVLGWCLGKSQAKRSKLLEPSANK